MNGRFHARDGRAGGHNLPPSQEESTAVCREADRPGKAFTLTHRARGVSLLESLIALLVLAVTVLGTVAGFVQALRSSHSALLHAQAQYLASDLAERIRSNPQARAAYVTPVGGATPDCDPAPCGPDAQIGRASCRERVSKQV